MTWIIGSGTPFGYAALVADTRVSWATGRTADILLKVHPVGPMMVAGFSGSVELGFALIADMQRCFTIPEGNIWFPRTAAWRWFRRARKIFREAPDDLKKLGCSLLLAGVSTHTNGPFNKAYCVRMVAPEFRPEDVPTGSWRSIGSGKYHSWAGEFEKSFDESFNNFGLAEGGMPGGFALIVAISLSAALREVPMASVGEATVQAIVQISGIEIKPVREIRNAGSSNERVIAPGRLATTWRDFCQMVQSIGGDVASAASAA